MTELEESPHPDELETAGERESNLDTLEMNTEQVKDLLRRGLKDKRDARV